MKNLETNNKERYEQHIQIIKKIISKILAKNIDIFDLCEKIYLSPDEFIDALKNVKANYKFYSEILDVVDRY